MYSRFIVSSYSLKMALFEFEKKAYSAGFNNIAGVDEAGRGSLAGPVVSAAVILPKRFKQFAGIYDSKQLSTGKREHLYDVIYASAVSIGIGVVDAFEIDRINILNASLLSMSIAVQNLYPQPDYLLVDGVFRIPINSFQRTVKKGDSLSVSIGSASIVAKVTRDRLMSQVDIMFPEFGFVRHKGYATKNHKENIRCFGSCHMHRKTFKGVRGFLRSRV